MRLFVGLMLIAALSAPAAAQSDKELCSTVGAPASQAAIQMRSLIDALDTLAILKKASSAFEGAELASMELLEERRLEALSSLTGFVDQLEDTAYVLQVCARR